MLNGDIPDFPSRHVYNQSPYCFGAIQILAKLSGVVLARLGCRCHVAFPVDNNLRPAALPLSNCIDDAGYCRERAAAYGKLLKLRDTDGFRKQFQ